MTRQAITVKDSDSVVKITDAVTTINSIVVGKGVSVTDAFGSNDLKVIITNSTATTYAITIGKGTAPNAIEAKDIVVNIDGGDEVSIGNLHDSQLIQTDGSLHIDFAANFEGSLVVFGKKVTLG